MMHWSGGAQIPGTSTGGQLEHATESRQSGTVVLSDRLVSAATRGSKFSAYQSSRSAEFRMESGRGRGVKSNAPVLDGVQEPHFGSDDVPG